MNDWTWKVIGEVKMNRRFVKKPLEIEAFRYGFDEMPEWGTHESIRHYWSADPKENYLLIKTLEGMMKADVGDYVIKGIKGEIYPCKADIFEASYDEVPCAYVAKVGAPFDAKVWAQPGNIIPCSE